MNNALKLGTLVSLMSGFAFAADDEKYWEQRDTNPSIADEKQKRDNNYWENRDPVPAVDRSVIEQQQLVVPEVTEQNAEPAPEAKAEPKEEGGKPGPMRRAVDRVGAGMENARERLSEGIDDAKDAANAVVAPLRNMEADRPDDKLGIAVEAGGGVGGFIDDRMSSQTTTQGQWTARAVFGTRSHFAGEAAYIGSLQGVNTLGVNEGARLSGHGGETSVRFNVLTGMWQPYATAGIGFMHYSLGDAQLTTSDVLPTADVATFPLGLGMAWRMNGLVLDGRVSFHPSTTSGILRHANLSTWDVNAKAGFEF